MEKNVLQKLEKKGFVSGETLAKELNVSRTAIWKYIKSLEQQGYVFDHKKTKGYRLVSRPDIPLPEEITPYIDTKIIGRQFYHFHKLPSTNNYAKELLKNNPQEGTIVICDIQTKGRGRKDRTWCSPEGGLWFSIILYPPIPPQKGMFVTMTASIAIWRAINENCDITPDIKWPNDLILQGRKICGILTELNAEMDTIHYSIIGIGLNVNNVIPSSLEKSAVSLKSMTNSHISKVKLLRSIITHFDELYQNILTKDFDVIRDLWLSLSNIIGKEIIVHGEKEKITGQVHDLDENGCLLLKTQKGVTHIVSGDIEYI